MKLTILRGISGSGKSTWARNQNAVVVSRDDLRTALFGPEYHTRTPDHASEELVTAAEHASIKAALKAGRVVISDNTNLRVKFAQKLADIGYALGAEVEVKVWQCDLRTALYRNDMRGRAGGRKVPDEIIRKQNDQLAGTRDWKPVKWAPTPYTGTPGKPDAFLFDLDGTLFHMNGKRGPFDWMKVDQDDLDENVAVMVRALYMSGMVAIAMSGRDAVCRELTIGALDYHDVPFDDLFMRPEKDMRKDSIIKDELFETHVAPYYNVRFVLDDRNQVVDMWRAKGLTVAQVAEGDF